MAAITAAVVVAAAAVYSGVQQRKAAKAQARSLRAQQRQADIANARERRNAVRAGRVARASVEAQAANTGLFGSSAAMGSTANIQSRTGENLSFLDQNAELSQAASVANQQAAGYIQKAQMGQTIGQIAGSFGSIYGGPAPDSTGTN
jgi:hypothetical protein